MIGNAVFILRTLLFWGLLAATLVESARQKKDVHHMIFLNDSRRPSRSHRHKDYQHHDFYKARKPSKPRKKPGTKESIAEDSSEESNHEDFLRHKPKSKRHHHKHTHDHQPSRHQKRHNNRGHHNNHQKHHKKEHPKHNNHGSYKPTQSNKFPDNWIPMSSKEFFGGEHQNHQYFSGNGLGHQGEGFIQSIPLEITTPLPLRSADPYQLQSTIYPPFSLGTQNLNNSPQSPLIGTVQPYKPFDYSILEQKPQPFEYRDQEVAASNVVNVKHTVGMGESSLSTYQGQDNISANNEVKVKHSAGKGDSPLSIIIENSRESLENKKQERDEEKRSEGADKSIEKTKEKRKKTRGGSRYRIRSKN